MQCRDIPNEINAFPSCPTSYPLVHVTRMAHGEGDFVRRAFWGLFEQPLGNLVHRFTMVVARKEVPVSVHRDLQRRMARESLHCLRGKPLFDPAGNREMAKAMPIEPSRSRRIALWLLPVLSLQRVEQRQEPPLDQVVVADVTAFSVGEDQVIRF